MIKWQVLIGVLLIAGCAAPTTSVRMLVPAEHHEVTEFRTISVLPFQGRNGERVANELECELVSLYFNNQPFFTVVERVRMQHALNELELGQTGLIDAQSVVEVGNMIGAEAIYTGSIISARVDQEYYTETRKECVQRKNPDKAYSECLRWQENSIECTKKIATFHLSPKIIVVESGHVVYAKNIRKVAEDSQCDDSATAISPNRGLIQQARTAAFKGFIKDVAPTYVDQELTMMNAVDGLNQAAVTRLKSGLSFAQEQRMGRACQLWNEAVQLNGRATLSLLYNLGVCAETQSDYMRALGYYNQADQKLAKPNDTVSEALRRIKLKIRQQEKLKLQL